MTGHESAIRGFRARGQPPLSFTHSVTHDNDDNDVTTSNQKARRRMIDEINDLFDVVASEKAEKSIDLFIEKRAKEAEEANKEQRLEEELDRRQRARQLKRQKENRESWIEFHGRQHRVFLDLAGLHAD